MIARRPLPPHLEGQSFSTAELRAAGLGLARTNARDVQRFSHGLYRGAGPSGPSWQACGLEDPGHGLSPQDVRALLRLRPDAVVSHLSAAHLYRVPLPRGLTASPAGRSPAGPGSLHLSVPHDGSRIRREGVVAHRRAVPDADVTSRLGLRVTSAARTWLDLAALWPRLDRDDLVVAGDHLVRHPWVRGEGRTDPLTTVTEVRAALHRAGRFRGIVAAREALDLVRVGADSPPETRLRLALVDAGLPEPGLQVPADPDDPSSPRADLGLVPWRIALQYEGHHHRDARQQELDAYRDAWFQVHGWLVIKVTGADLRNGFRRVVRLVRERMASHGR
ncbi:hypothetical protein E7744_03200 [Citricoccus sp. SGAir0253]|uniref:hypothetical protein n=1 Tax=Citricoccus sp. SGAir0253 TaxID=2567881 RepID=UPI0010CCBA4A|nr:hypothetical protein [Citricoccus sp. SGAir0253]QCU77331.1 hypothetical protein E7744_03200 [Citricoccus sp. SGAir0253]